MKLLDIYSRFKRDIQRIEDELERTVKDDHPFLEQTSLHLLKAGGKRIRPVFVLLSGQFGGYDLDRLKHVAVALELIHMASLVHDDVIDDAETRRGKLTVKSKWDNRIAMYTGDYIFANALNVITELEDPEIHRILSRAILQMTIGEMEQIRFFFHTGQSVRDYLLRIRRKTALLIAISCQLGAIAAQVPAAYANRLYAFGYNAGMAFQIRDDILDICGTEKELGKPPGSDIRQGNITLPLIYALREPGIRQPLLDGIECISRGDLSRMESVLRLLRDSEGMQQAAHMVDRYIDKALASLVGLPDGEARRDLIEIAHFFGNRNY